MPKSAIVKKAQQRRREKQLKFTGSEGMTQIYNKEIEMLERKAQRQQALEPINKNIQKYQDLEYQENYNITEALASLINLIISDYYMTEKDFAKNYILEGYSFNEKFEELDSSDKSSDQEHDINYIFLKNFLKNWNNAQIQKKNIMNQKLDSYINQAQQISDYKKLTKKDKQYLIETIQTYFLNSFDEFNKLKDDRLDDWCGQYDEYWTKRDKLEREIKEQQNQLIKTHVIKEPLKDFTEIVELEPSSESSYLLSSSVDSNKSQKYETNSIGKHEELMKKAQQQIIEKQQKKQVQIPDIKSNANLTNLIQKQINKETYTFNQIDSPDKLLYFIKQYVQALPIVSKLYYNENNFPYTNSFDEQSQQKYEKFIKNVNFVKQLLKQQKGADESQMFDELSLYLQDGATDKDQLFFLRRFRSATPLFVQALKESEIIPFEEIKDFELTLNGMMFKNPRQLIDYSKLESHKSSDDPYFDPNKTISEHTSEQDSEHFIPSQSSLSRSIKSQRTPINSQGSISNPVLNEDQIEEEKISEQQIQDMSTVQQLERLKALRKQTVPSAVPMLPRNKVQFSSSSSSNKPVFKIKGGKSIRSVKSSVPNLTSRLDVLGAQIARLKMELKRDPNNTQKRKELEEKELELEQLIQEVRSSNQNDQQLEEAKSSNQKGQQIEEVKSVGSMPPLEQVSSASQREEARKKANKDEMELLYLNQIAKKIKALNWNFFTQQTGITREQLEQMKELPPNRQEVKDTITQMMQSAKAQAVHSKVMEEILKGENSVHRRLLQLGFKQEDEYLANFGQVAGNNNGIIQPDPEILNEPGQNQQNVSNATSVKSQINNGVIPGIPDQSIHSMMRAIVHRLVNRATYLGAPPQFINRIRGLSDSFSRAEAIAQPGADAAERRMELEAQNRLTIQSQNAPEVLAQVPNTNGIINYRDQQENDRTLSLTNIVNNESFNVVLDRLSASSNLTSQQSQLLHQSMTGDTLLLNAVAQSNPDSLVRREQQVRNPFEESKGSAHSRSNIIQPPSSNSSMQSRASRRLNRTQQVNYLGYPELPNQSARYPELPDRSVRYPELPDRSQAISQVEDESFIFGIPSQNESQSDISIIHPQFEGIGNPSRAEIESILNDLNSSLGLHLSSDDILSSDNHLHLPFSSDSQDPESNPFNNWFNQVFRGQNMPVNQQQPMVRNGIVVQRPALTAQNFATFLWQAVQFISEISGPIQSAILKTYQKQTKVYQIPIEKKETTSFKIRPGAAYKIRACE